MAEPEVIRREFLRMTGQRVLELSKHPVVDLYGRTVKRLLRRRCAAVEDWSILLMRDER